MRSFDEYTEFLTVVSEGRESKLYATNKYHTKEEEADLKHNEELRMKALQESNYIKD